mmetsp:Transcript_24245/g.24862  ORF Transcript_24245/g.24862 Transcript_24245/m.24862 type:complete len:263 (-) Transcript_24245:95-883(-)
MEGAEEIRDLIQLAKLLYDYRLTTISHRKPLEKELRRIFDDHYPESAISRLSFDDRICRVSSIISNTCGFDENLWLVSSVNHELSLQENTLNIKISFDVKEKEEYLKININHWSIRNIKNENVISNIGDYKINISIDLQKIEFIDDEYQLKLNLFDLPFHIITISKEAIENLKISPELTETLDTTETSKSISNTTEISKSNPEPKQTQILNPEPKQTQNQTQKQTQESKDSGVSLNLKVGAGIAIVLSIIGAIAGLLVNSSH